MRRIPVGFLVLGLIVPGLLCFLAWLLSPSNAIAEDEKPDKYAKGKNFDVFAKDEKVAAKRLEELEWAAERFKKLVGAYPPRGAVVLVSQSLEEFKKDIAKGKETVSHSSSFGPEMEKYKKYGATWVFPWIEGLDSLIGGNEGKSGKGKPSGQPRGPEGVQALTHEVAHTMFMHFVNPGCCEAIRKKFNGYGSFLPDWLDEGMAVYHESDTMRKERYEQLKGRMGKRIAFKEFFTMDHPSVKGMQTDPGKPPDPEELRKRAEEGSKASDEWIVFYAQSLAVLEFFADMGVREKLDRPVLTQTGKGSDKASDELGGGAIIMQMCAEFQQGKTIQEALDKLFPPKYRDIDKLEEQWKTWLKSR